MLYVLMHHADSFESAVIAAVNDTKDNDTVASIVGAFTGGTCAATARSVGMARRHLVGVPGAPDGRTG